MSRKRSLCIHGHFYQPPREDPWLGRILIEASAAPMRHWNERIARESYAPLAWARRNGGDGKTIDIINCFEWISFNVGPTLMRWMERRDPSTYARILEADAVSRARWGHGNAMAQVYHHVIMPLATERDRRLECAWALADFKARFGRDAEGMWLSECAVDIPSLEILADAGIRFVTLAPRQAGAVVLPDGSQRPVDENSLDIRRPYRVDLPSGKSMAVFFYHAPLSQAVAFEGLLRDGERFWNRVRDTALSSPSEDTEILTLSTDGETYGHHFHFGEMALAYLLSQGYASRDGLGLTNFGAFLEENPPVQRVLLHEPSSWSCAHGIERWRSNCGCKDGGHPDWNQEWRGPLRSALDRVRAKLGEHFFAAGARLFIDPEAALIDYGEVLASPEKNGEFLARHATAGTAPNEDAIWKLLAMQEQALAAYASCAWFFDDISRLEPVNAMTFMWRALELAGQTGFSAARETAEAFEAELGKAVSNKAEEGSGADILRRRVLPRRQDAASLTLMALLALERRNEIPAEGMEATYSWPDASVRVHLGKAGERGKLRGTADIRTTLEKNGYTVDWEWLPPSRPDERRPEAPFVPLSESRVSVRLADGETLDKKAEELPRHVRAYYSLREMGCGAALSSEARTAMARHALSLLDVWEEGQTGEPYPWDWAEFVPYLAFACVTDDTLPDTRRNAAASFLADLHSDAAQRKAGLLLQDAMLARLELPVPDIGTLVTWVRRARTFLPAMDWWAVQNAVWKRGAFKQEYRELAEALGFRIR